MFSHHFTLCLNGQRDIQCGQSLFCRGEYIVIYVSEEEYKQKTWTAPATQIMLLSRLLDCYVFIAVAHFHFSSDLHVVKMKALSSPSVGLG